MLCNKATLRDQITHFNLHLMRCYRAQFTSEQRLHLHRVMMTECVRRFAFEPLSLSRLFRGLFSTALSMLRNHRHRPATLHTDEQNTYSTHTATTCPPCHSADTQACAGSHMLAVAMATQTNRAPQWAETQRRRRTRTAFGTKTPSRKVNEVH